MRNITTLVMLRGSVVHQVIAESLESVRSGSVTSTEYALERVTDIMREKMRESYYRLWHPSNRPPGSKQSEFTNLLEHYYSFPDTEQRAREHRDIAQACIKNLFGSELWNQIISTDPETWRTIDHGFPRFEVDGIVVYARPDFAHAHNRPTIIDWKTGQPGNEDRSQLVLYSLYAQDRWGWDPTDTTLIAVYLYPELTIDEFIPQQEHVDEVIRMVKQSFEQMLELEPVLSEPADIARFPITDDIYQCYWCRFQGICEGARRLTPSVEPPDRIVENGSEGYPEDVGY